MSRAELMRLDLVVHSLDRKAIRARGDAGATHKVVESVLRSVFGQPTPEGAQNDTTPMRGSDTGSTDFQKSPGKGEHPIEVEFALRVEIAQATGLGVRQEPRAGDDISSLEVVYQEVITELIDGVGIKTGLHGVELGPHLVGEHLIPQLLRRGDVGALGRDFGRVASWLGERFFGARIRHEALSRPDFDGTIQSLNDRNMSSW